MERLRASEWLQITETELDRAARFLEQDDVYAAYCLDQALQACLLAFLLHSGESLESDVEYDLEDLVNRASELDREVRARGDTLRSVAALSDMARHPGRHPERAGVEQMLRAIDAALQATSPFVEHVRNALSSESE